MKILNWLKRKNSGADVSTLILQDNEDEKLSGLSMKSAIDSHMAWRNRLHAVLAGTSDEQLEIGEVARDDCCMVGKWIHGQGKADYGHLIEYAALKVTHAEFHLAAGEILVEHRNGNVAHAENLLKNQFKRLSDRIQLDIVRLFSKSRSA
jgi:hypothetical protein